MGDGSSSLSWWAFGMEAPLAELPSGDHWWYPQKTFWRMATGFAGVQSELGGGDRAAAARFRATTP